MVDLVQIRWVEGVHRKDKHEEQGKGISKHWALREGTLMEVLVEHISISWKEYCTFAVSMVCSVPDVPQDRLGVVHSRDQQLSASWRM